MGKIVKYGISALAVVLILIYSVHFKKLDEVRASGTEGDFDAAAYAQNFWNEQLPASLEKAVNVETLLANLEQNFDSTANKGQKIGISDSRYFLVRGSGTVTDILKDDVLIEVDDRYKIRLATGFIFGNTVRNAAPGIHIGEFVNMTQFNRVSIEINELVKKRVVPNLKENAQVGNKISFAGALSVDVESRKLDSLRVVPLQINKEGN